MKRFPLILVFTLCALSVFGQRIRPNPATTNDTEDLLTFFENIALSSGSNSVTSANDNMNVITNGGSGTFQLNVHDQAKLTNTVRGESLLGPVPNLSLGGGSPNSSTFLRGDRVWAVPPGSGGSFTGNPRQFNSSGGFTNLEAGAISSSNFNADATAFIANTAVGSSNGVFNSIVSALIGPTVVFPGAYNASEAANFGFAISPDGGQSVYEPYHSSWIGNVDSILQAAGQPVSQNWDQDYCLFYDAQNDWFLMTLTAAFGGSAAQLTGAWTNSAPLLISTNGFDWSFYCPIQFSTNNGSAHAWVSDFIRGGSVPILTYQNTNNGPMMATWPTDPLRQNWVYPGVVIQGDYQTNFGYDAHFTPIPGSQYGLIYKGLSGADQNQWSFCTATGPTNYYNRIPGWEYPFSYLTNLSPAVATAPEGPSLIHLPNGYWVLLGLYNTGNPNPGWFLSYTLDFTNWSKAFNMRFSRIAYNHFSPYIPTDKEYAKWLYSFHSYNALDYFGPTARFQGHGQLFNSAYPDGGSWRWSLPNQSFNMGMSYRYNNGTVMSGFRTGYNSLVGAGSQIGFRLDDNGSLGPTVQVGKVPTNTVSDNGHIKTTLTAYAHAADTNIFAGADSGGVVQFAVATNGAVYLGGGTNTINGPTNPVPTDAITPHGWLTITNGGNQYKIPLYQ